LSKVSKYDGFCCIPSHLDYRQIIDGFYNMYNEIPYQPVKKIQVLKLKKENSILT
jgi:hypothetical protein